MITIGRIFLASWKNLGRNAWIALATIFVFTMALLSVNVVLGVNAMVTRVVALLEAKVDMTVTFKPETTEAIVIQARFYLVSLPQVTEAKMVTAAEALALFKQRNANDPKALAALAELPGNPLGAQLVVKARHTEDYPFLAQAIQSPQYAPWIQAQTYDDHAIAIARVRDIGRQVRIAGAGLVALFALFGLLIAFNAIRVAIYTQRDEIAIMWLVGASSSYIRGPFLLEGIWLALLSVVVTIGTIIPLVLWLEQALRPFFDGGEAGLANFFFGQWPIVGGLQVGSLLLLVVVMSWMAVGRYIRK